MSLSQAAVVDAFSYCQNRKKAAAKNVFVSCGEQGSPGRAAAALVAPHLAEGKMAAALHIDDTVS